MAFNTRPEDYDKIVDPLAEQYGPKALALLGKVRNLVAEAGFEILHEPADIGCDDYKWSLTIRPAGTTDDDSMIDISIEIAESQEYGDSDEHPYGINFGLDIVKWGGEILGGFTPFNYTPLCWVDAKDSEAIEQRWNILEGADLSEIPSLCQR